MNQIRVLHVIGGMHRAGIETWLMHVYRNIDRKRFKFDFLVHTDQECGYDPEIRELGGRLLYCPSPSQPHKYLKNFLKTIKQTGPYDVVHSHVHHFSGFVMRLAHMAGVKARIAHSHNDTTPAEANASFARRMYLNLMQSWTNSYASAGLAASRRAASSFFGEDWQKDPRWKLMFYGIDFQPFEAEVDKRKIRNELGIPEDAFVVGHVGRFHDQKNHEFLIDIAHEVARRKDNAVFLLLGEGPLLSRIQQKVAELGLSNRTIFPGVRGNIPTIMRGAMDRFLFPSKYEGLGIVLIEAQAAGLPCVYSDVIPHEADVIPELVQRLNLATPADVWAEAVLKEAPGISQRAALKRLEQSAFNINSQVHSVQSFYEKAVS